MSLIEKNLYKQIIKSIPILCVDIIIRFEDNYLLVKRNEEPLKDMLWVPGGRVLIGEKAIDAAKRKLIEEIGLSDINKIKRVGIYEDTFNESSFGKHIYQTVSILYEVEITDISSIKLDSTSTKWELKNNLPERFKNKMELNNV